MDYNPNNDYTDTAMFRLCGGKWAYCDNNCSTCKNISTVTTTLPTQSPYYKKSDIENYLSSIK